MSLSALTGSRLRERRLALGMRQAELAAEVGVSASYLNLIEHNRRRIADDLLLRLADRLAMPLAALQDGHDAVMIDALRAAASDVHGVAEEVDRAEDLAGRFPGWAAAVVELHARARALGQVVEALNDRMAHDPHLSASLHEILNAAASVRSTAAILADTDDIDPAWRKRFHQNLHVDSERMAKGAEALVAYLDASSQGVEQTTATPQEEVEAWASSCDWGLSGPEASVKAAQLASGDGRAMAGRMQALAKADALALSEPALQSALQAHGPDPLAIAAQTGVPVLVAFRRLALRPASGFGLLHCDGSGTLTLRKPILGFSPPRFGAACPLWPLFTALSRPETPVEAVIALPGPQGARFRTLALCQTQYPAGFRGPQLREAAMLLVPEAPGSAPAIEVGPTCRICPRPQCPARREASILTV